MGTVPGPTTKTEYLPSVSRRLHNNNNINKINNIINNNSSTSNNNHNNSSSSSISSPFSSMPIRPTGSFKCRQDSRMCHINRSRCNTIRNHQSRHST